MIKKELIFIGSKIMAIGQSELILNPNKSLYHISLPTEYIADTIFLVGDPDRVPKVSKHFDKIIYTNQHREINVHCGELNGKLYNVISTGMGTDNIDIVLSELDASVNIDLDTGEIKKEKRVLNFIRLGTSGSFQPDIDVDSFVASEYTLGLDNLMHFYKTPQDFFETQIEEAFIKHTTSWPKALSRPYVIKNKSLISDTILKNPAFHSGFTVTASGFYAPQGRQLRAQVSIDDFYKDLNSFRYDNLKLTNMEMETSGIYGLSKLLGHESCSINCIVANRNTQTFSKDSNKSVEKMIVLALETLA